MLFQPQLSFRSKGALQKPSESQEQTSGSTYDMGETEQNLHCLRNITFYSYIRLLDIEDLGSKEYEK